MINVLINNKSTLDYDNLQCSVYVPSSKDVGTVNTGAISSFNQHFLQGESESQQVNTHCQTKLEQEPTQKVLLGLGREENTFRQINIHCDTNTLAFLYQSCI